MVKFAYVKNYAEENDNILFVQNFHDNTLADCLEEENDIKIVLDHFGIIGV